MRTGVLLLTGGAAILGATWYVGHAAEPRWGTIVELGSGMEAGWVMPSDPAQSHEAWDVTGWRSTYGSRVSFPADAHSRV